MSNEKLLRLLLQKSSQILYETYSSLQNLPTDQPSHIASNILKKKDQSLVRTGPKDSRK